MIKILERAIAAISPQWACNRAFYAENLRAYEAGEVTRFNDGWMPVNQDTETIVLQLTAEAPVIFWEVWG